MLSKRNFLMMFIMIIVVLALFLSSVVLKEYYNDYDVNHMANTEIIEKNDNFTSDGQILCFGEDDNGYTSVIEEWSGYRKKEFMVFSSLDSAGEIIGTPDSEKTYLLIDGKLLESNTEKYAIMLTEYVKKGGTLIFYRLPSYETISESYSLQELLGIQRLRAKSVKLLEIRLYSGFLLGGETHYSFDEASNPDLADMESEIPWYDISARTKTYMVGFISEKEKNPLELTTRICLPLSGEAIWIKVLYLQ